MGSINLKNLYFFLIISFKTNELKHEKELNATFIQVKPNRQAGKIVMRQIALVSRIKLFSNMTAPGIEPGSRSGAHGCRALTPELRPMLPH